VNNKAGSLKLSEVGSKFYDNPTQVQLAGIIQDRVRLFAEVLDIIHTNPSTVEVVDERLQSTYNLNWLNLSNTRRRMDWLEVLGLIDSVGERKWGTTDTGDIALKQWGTIEPEALESTDSENENIEIAEAPVEISVLFQNLMDFPEAHHKRSTYNIWVPSPNRIDNLRRIIQAAVERIDRAELFSFISDEFHLKESSVESMLPFLKASGLLQEVGKGVYRATTAATAWIETGSDFDFIRILHAHMRFVGEMIEAVKDDTTRNDLYARAKSYGLNTDKARWIAGFLLEAGLLEEPQYLHLKATPTGMRFVQSLPLVDESPEVEGVQEAPKEDHRSAFPDQPAHNTLDRLISASCNPLAAGEASGVAFEKAIAEAFRLMGFDAERIGGSGDTDVIVRWKEKDGTSKIAIVDGKSKAGGTVSHADISDVAIDAHKEKNGADYVGIVGPAFNGDTIKNYARKKGYALIAADYLCEITRASESVGLSLEELSMLFHVPNGLQQLNELIISKQRELEIVETVIQKLSQKQETLGGLSPRDLFFMLENASISPSLQELCGLVDTLSQPEIGVLRIIEENQDASKTTYGISAAKQAVNHLRALANAIDNALGK
jgi:hypothetical protein